MSQLERLQSLLERVQHNRAQPRDARQVSAVAVEPAVVHNTVQAAVPARMASGAPNPPMPSPARAASSVPPPTPRGGRASMPFEQPAERPIGSVPPPPPPSAPSSRPPARASGPQRIDGDLPAISHPVAQVVSPAPRVEQPTFGELLRRSLSLRPR